MYHIVNKRFKNIQRIIATGVALIFSLSLITPSAVYAQPVSVLNLPIPGTLVQPSPAFFPPVLKGLKVYPQEPFKFDFVVDAGEAKIQGEDLKAESEKLIKYFLASLTIPEKDMWVNLSPYEEGRIIPEGFGVTEMGRDLLAEDYILKQLTASLVYPEDELGKTFWDRVRLKVKEQYGNADIPASTFNKVWIVPETAGIYENGNVAFVTRAHLKVMLEEDYMAQKSGSYSSGTTNSELMTSIVREIILPEIEKEVNEGKNFQKLRQIYYSLILATWYKRRLKESHLSRIYVDQQKTDGVDVDDKDIKKKIYEQYVEAYRKGVYNYIKEDYDLVTGQIIPRKYFSGGAVMNVEEVLDTGDAITDVAMLGEAFQVGADVQPVNGNGDKEFVQVGKARVSRVKLDAFRDELGLSEEQLARPMTLFPQLASYDPARVRQDFERELGMGREELTQAIMGHPAVVGLDLVRVRQEFETELGMNRARLVAAIARFPTIASYDIVNNLKPKLAIVRAIKTPVDEEIRALITLASLNLAVVDFILQTARDAGYEFTTATQIRSTYRRVNAAAKRDLESSVSGLMKDDSDRLKSMIKEVLPSVFRRSAPRDNAMLAMPEPVVEAGITAPAENLKELWERSKSVLTLSLPPGVVEGETDWSQVDRLGVAWTADKSKFFTVQVQDREQFLSWLGRYLAYEAENNSNADIRNNADRLLRGAVRFLAQEDDSRADLAGRAQTRGVAQVVREESDMLASIIGEKPQAQNFFTEWNDAGIFVEQQLTVPSRITDQQTLSRLFTSAGIIILEHQRSFAVVLQVFRRLALIWQEVEDDDLRAFIRDLYQSLRAQLTDAGITDRTVAVILDAYTALAENRIDEVKEILKRLYNPTFFNVLREQEPYLIPAIDDLNDVYGELVIGPQEMERIGLQVSFMLGEGGHIQPGLSGAFAGDQASLPPNVPTLIDGVRVLKLLAQGGQGLVLLGIDLENSRPVVVKLAKKGSEVGEPLLEDHELKTIRRLQLEDPAAEGKIPIAFYGGEDHLVLEYVEAPTLETFLRDNQGFSNYEASQMILHIAEILGMVHRGRQVYKDIKPSNILVKDSQSVVLIDFGIVEDQQVSEAPGEERMVAGTPEYLSPPVYDGYYAQPSDDIYALGVVFYELLEGRKPFDMDVLAEQYEMPQLYLALNKAKRSEPLVFSNGIPEVLQKIIRKALAPQRADEYQNVNEFIRDLEAAMRQLPPLRLATKEPVEAEEVKVDIGVADRLWAVMPNSVQQALINMGEQSLARIGYTENMERQLADVPADQQSSAGSLQAEFRRARKRNIWTAMGKYIELLPEDLFREFEQAVMDPVRVDPSTAGVLEDILGKIRNLREQQKVSVLQMQSLEQTRKTEKMFFESSRLLQQAESAIGLADWSAAISALYRWEAMDLARYPEFFAGHIQQAQRIRLQLVRGYMAPEGLLLDERIATSTRLLNEINRWSYDVLTEHDRLSSVISSWTILLSNFFSLPRQQQAELTQRISTVFQNFNRKVAQIKGSGSASLGNLDGLAGRQVGAALREVRTWGSGKMIGQRMKAQEALLSIRQHLPRMSLEQQISYWQMTQDNFRSLFRAMNDIEKTLAAGPWTLEAMDEIERNLSGGFEITADNWYYQRLAALTREIRSAVAGYAQAAQGGAVIDWSRETIDVPVPAEPSASAKDPALLTPGGVDFNPENIQIDVEKGSRVNIFPNNISEADYIRMGGPALNDIQGLIPVIYSITPLPAINPVLGFIESTPQKDTLSLLRK